MKKIDFRVALPNLITIIGLCLGLNSLRLAFEGNFEKALIFIVLASIVDALDGRIARLIKGTSKFGADMSVMLGIYDINATDTRCAREVVSEVVSEVVCALT